MRKSGLIILVCFLVLCYQHSWNGFGVEAQINLPFTLTALNASSSLFQDFEKYVVAPMTNYRNFLLTNQLPGDATYNAGKILTNSIIAWFASFPRYQIWDISNSTFLPQTSMKQFLLPVANGTSYTALSQTASEYGQGLVLFTLFGIGGMLVTIICALYWFAIICWSKIFCFCCCCRAPLVFKNDRKACDFCCLFAAEDKKKHKSNFVTWKVNTVVKFSCRIILQLLLLVFFVAFLGLIIVWGLFANQLSTDLSGMLETGKNITSSATTKAASAARSANSILPNTVSIVNQSLIQFSNNLKSTLPNQSQLSGYTSCIADIFTQLPNATVLNSYVSNLYGSLNSLPTVSSLQSNVSSINSSFATLSVSAINDLYFAAATAVSETGFAYGLSGSINYVETARTSLNTAASAILANLSSTAQTDIDPEVINLNTATTQVVSSLNTLGSDAETYNSRATKLNSLLTSFNNLKNKFPSFLSNVNTLFNHLSNSNMTVAAAELEHRMNGLDHVITGSSFSTITSKIVFFNSSVNNAQSALNGFKSVLQGVYNNLINIPPASIISNEFAKIQNISTQTQCVQNLSNFITLLNNTLLLIPANITAPLGLLTQLGPTISQYNSSFSSIISNIQSISTSFAPQLNTTLNSLDLSSTFSAFSNLSSITTAMSTLSQEVQSAVSQAQTNGTLDWTSLKSTLVSFTTIIQQISPSAIQSVFNQLGNAISQFNTAAISNVINQLPNESGYSGGAGTCSNAASPACPSATLTSLKNTLLTSLSNLNVQSLSASYNNFSVSTRFTNAGSAASNTSWNTVTPSLNVQIQTINQIINPVNSALTTTYNAIGAIRSGLVSAVGSLSFSSMNSLLNSVGSVLGQVPTQSSVQSQLSALTSITSTVDVSSVTSLLNAASTALNSLDLSSMIGSQLGSLSSATGMFDSIVNLISPIQQSYDVVSPVISGFDGYRLLLSGLVIFILTLPLPFLVTGGICFPKQPGFLLCAAAIYLIVAFLSFAVVGIVVPIDLILYDNCPTIETNIARVVTYLPTDLTSMLSLNQSISLGSLGNIQLEVNAVSMGVQFINGTCDGTDALTQTFNTVLTALNGVISSAVTTAVAQVNLPFGMQLHPNLLSSLSSTSTQIISSIRTNVLGDIQTYIGCSSINGLYSSVKTLVCSNIQYWITDFLALAFLMGALMVVASLVFPTFYICLICTWTRGVIIPPFGRSDKVAPSEGTTETQQGTAVSVSGKAKIKKVTIVETIEQ